MAPSPTVSVIVPAYNAEKYLKRCLDSMIAQDMKDWECIVIDDGSTDETGRIADAYALEDGRFRVIHKANGGVSSARNTGLEAACGTWVVFVDADDYIAGDYFPSNPDPETDMFIQNWKFHGAEEFNEYLEPGTIPDNEYENFLKENAHKDIFRGVLSKFVKRGILNDHAIRFDEQQRLGEDTLFFMECVPYCHHIQILDNGLYLYDRHDSDWAKKYDYAMTDVVSFFQAFLERYQALPVKLPRLAEFVFFWYCGLVDESVLSSWQWKLDPAVIRMKEEIPRHSWISKGKLALARLLSSLRK